MFDLAQGWRQIFLKLEISLAHLVFVAAHDGGLVHNTLLFLRISFLLDFSVAFDDPFARFFHAVSVVADQGLHDVHLAPNQLVGLRKGCLLQSFFMGSLAMSVLLGLLLQAVGFVHTFRQIRITAVFLVIVGWFAALFVIRGRFRNDRLILEAESFRSFDFCFLLLKHFV